MRSAIRLINNAPTMLLCLQISAFVSPWLIVLWLSHQADVQSVSDFSYLLAILSPLSLLLALPSRNYLLSTQKIGWPDAFGLRTVLLVYGAAIALGIGLWFGQWQFVFAIFLYKSAEFLFDIPVANAIASKNNKTLFLLTVTKWLCLLISVATVWFSKSLNLSLLILAILFIVSAAASVRWKIHFAFGQMPTMVKWAMPLSLSALVFSVYFNIPRYVLGNANEPEMLSIFTVSSFVVMAALVMLNSVIQARLPQMTTALSTDFRVFWRQFGVCFLVGSVIYACLQVGHLEWTSHVFWQTHNNIQFSIDEGIKIYHWVLIFSAGPLLFSAANYLFMVSGRHRLLLVYTLLNTLICLVFAKWSFETFQFLGLMITVLVSSILQCVGGVWSLYRGR